jgi:hypothetical protein
MMENNTRRAIVAVRMSEAERDTLFEMARRDRTSVSQLVRRAILGPSEAGGQGRNAEEANGK